MKQVCARLSLLCLVLFAAVATAYGQPPALPAENHYQVYSATPITLYRPVGVTDQFGYIPNYTWELDRWANPATKIHDGVTYPPVDPAAHQTWWRIVPLIPQPERTVLAIDQFGSSLVKLGNPVYLLNPALKNVLPPYPPLPVRNHYLCYEVIGAIPLYKTVVLYDQWGTRTAQVYQAKLFCNPAEKTDSTGVVYPIIDARAHLQCYRIDPNPLGHALTAVDQFEYWQFDAYNNDCLCVPALKDHIVGTKPSTWGQIKALYQ